MATTEVRSPSRRAGLLSRAAPLFRLRDAFPTSPPGAGGELPPGQRALASYPRYGTHFARRDPRAPARPQIALIGAGADALDAEALDELPRVDVVADFHCVAGWTARDVHWEGVRLRDVYARFLAGQNGAAPTTVTHIRAVGRDGFRSVLALEDALGDDVLIADRLHGAPLPSEHGGPYRLVSPSQYGYKSVKFLEQIEFHDTKPSDAHLRPSTAAAIKVVGMHPRARVWHEERHWLFPGRSQRFLNIRVIHPFGYMLGYLGARLGARYGPRD